MLLGSISVQCMVPLCDRMFTVFLVSRVQHRWITLLCKILYLLLLLLLFALKSKHVNKTKQKITKQEHKIKHTTKTS